MDQWLTVHMIQLPLFGLLAVAIFLLTNRFSGRAVLVSRIALEFFVVFYTALDFGWRSCQNESKEKG